MYSIDYIIGPLYSKQQSMMLLLLYDMQVHFLCKFVTDLSRGLFVTPPPQNSRNFFFFHFLLEFRITPLLPQRVRWGHNRV